MWKNQKQQTNEQEIPDEASHLALTHQLGQPIAFYRFPLFWLRLCLYVPRAFLFIALCLFVLRLSLDIMWFVQLQTVHDEEQMLTLQNNLIVGLFAALFMAPLLIGFLVYVIRTLSRTIPRYLLVCREGLLCVFPKGTDVTRWSEVTGVFKPARRHYRLLRAERKPLSFGYPLENVEGLADLVKQYIKK